MKGKVQWQWSSNLAPPITRNMKRQQEKAETSNRGRDNGDENSNDDDLFLSDDASLPNSEDMRRTGQQMKKTAADKKKKDGEAMVAAPTTSGKPSSSSKIAPTGTTGMEKATMRIFGAKKKETPPAASLGNDREFFMRDYAPPQIRVFNRAGNGQGGGLRNAEAQVRQQTIGGTILRDRHFIVMCAQALFLFVIMSILINLILSRSARRT